MAQSPLSLSDQDLRTHILVSVAEHKRRARRLGVSIMKNLFAMKRPLSPGVAILNKGACGLCSHFNVRCEIFAGVLSRSLIVDHANSAAPLSVNLT